MMKGHDYLLDSNKNELQKERERQKIRVAIHKKQKTFLHARFSSVQLNCVKTSGLQVKALQKVFLVLIQHVK